MYLLTTSQPFPTLPWKQLGAHICSPHHSLRCGNSFLKILLVLPFSLLAMKLSEYFGGYLKKICTWSGLTAISIISIPSSLQVLQIMPSHIIATSPVSIFPLYLGANTICPLNRDNNQTLSF